MLSESRELRRAINRLLDIIGEGGKPSRHEAISMATSHDIKVVVSWLERLEGQATHGQHRNPPLILLSNPPMKYRGSRTGHGSLKFLDVISDEAHAILYRHAEDGQPYRHDFEHPTQLIAVDRDGKHDVLITSVDRSPIWRDF